ncbi:MAG TPA: hypothetical protein VMJ32_10505 [Pirellulales bacterium]|nr:hypothetical protein [Pirellulales bacterium]
MLFFLPVLALRDLFAKMPSVPSSRLIPAQAGLWALSIPNVHWSVSLADWYAKMVDYFAFHATAEECADAGIYKRERADSLTDEEVGSFEQQSGGLLNAILKLDLLEEHARNAVRCHLSLAKSAKNAIYLDLGEGPKPFRIHADIPDNVRDLIEFLAAAFAVRNLVAASADHQHLAVMAVTLGQIMERIRVRPFDGLVKKAKKLQQRAVAAGKTRVLLTDKQQRDAIHDIQKLIKRMPLQSACKELQPKYGVSFKTLMRYFKRERQP